MAYGVNAPNGLVPKGFMLGSLPSSGLASQALVTLNIQNGYNDNIGLGDPVFWCPLAAPFSGAGYIVAASKLLDIVSDKISVVNTPILGVFAGCQYSTNNDLYQNLPMQLSWKANTQTSDGTDPIAFVILPTYQPGFSIQTSSAGCLRTGLFQMGTIVIPTDPTTGEIVLNGDQSTAYLDMGAGNGIPYDAGATASSFQVIGFDDPLGTSGRTAGNPTGPYSNVIGRIANSPFPTFSTASAF